MRKKAIKFPNYNTEFIKSRENRGRNIVDVVAFVVVNAVAARTDIAVLVVVVSVLGTVVAILEEV